MNKILPLDIKEREEISSGLEETYMVEAGAGTGKTTLLVERILNLLIHKRVEIKKIVAITFTEKSAVELKERINNRLIKSINDKGIPAETKKLLKRSQEQLPIAPIGTIHSFASSILREMSIDAQLNPFFSVQDELSGYVLFKKLWEEWVGEVASKYPEKEVNNEKRDTEKELRYLIRSGFGFVQLEELAKEMLRAKGIFCRECNEGGVDEFFSAFYGKVVALYNRTESACKNHLDKGYIESRVLLDEVQSIQMESDQLARVSRLKQLKVKTGKGNKKNYHPAEELKEIKAQFSELSKELDEFKLNSEHKLISRAVSFLRPFCDFLEAEKEKEELLTFDDLLYNCAKLLRSNISARNKLKKRFKYIFIDEFQDVDPLQVEIVFYLSEVVTEKERECSKDWKNVVIEKGKLFIVGDPKQSIYRFRNADMEMYLDVCEKIKKEGNFTRIRQNFRSREGIIRWSNIFFSQVIEQEDGHQAEYVPLAPKEKDTHRSVIHLLPSTKEKERLAKENISQKRKSEAEGIAKFLKQELNSGATLQNKQKLMPRDCAILFRSLNPSDIYLKALRDEGIPCHIVGGKTYFKTSEVSYLISLMTALDSPFEEIELVAALKSPFFSISDQELFLFKKAGGSFNFLDSIEPENTEGFSGIISAYRILKELYEEKSRGSLAIFIEQIFRKTDIFLTLTLSSTGLQKIANLKKIIEYAWAFKNSAKVGSITLKQFTMWLKDMQSGGIETEEPKLSSEENAVNIISIHKSKGLEFPLVIVADMFCKASNKSKRTLISRTKAGDGSLVRNLELNIAKNKTLGWKAAEEEDKRKDLAEEARIFYVAATRAKDCLVLPIYISKGGKKYLDWFRKTYPINENGELDVEDIENSPFAEFTESRVAPFVSDSLGAITEQEKTKRKKVLSPEEYSAKKNEWIKAREELISSSSLTPVLVTPSRIKAHEVQKKTSPRKDGKKFGRTVHRILELIDFRKIDRLMGLCELEGNRHDIDPDELFGLIEQNLSTPLFQRIIKSEICLKEVSFGKSYDNKVIHGQADLLFLENNKWTLVDYKTDSVSEKEIGDAKKQYTAQIQAYITGLRENFPHEISDAYIHFVTPATSVEVAV